MMLCLISFLSSSQIQPHVAILPLGTGNDLARVLGWGDGFNAGDDVLEYLDDVMSYFFSIFLTDAASCSYSSSWHWE